MSRRNAQYQQWSALLTNRNKRQRSRAFLVQGVRPVELAVRFGWPLRTLLHARTEGLSSWARELLAEAGGDRAELTVELLAELGQQDEGVPEILAVAELPDDDLGRIPAGPDLLLPVFDRPASPGNIGTLVRAVDALGASGLATVGHAADVYDPKSLRASTGSLFAVPAVRAASARTVLDRIEDWRGEGLPVTVLGLDESGLDTLDQADLTGPVVLAVGSERLGLSTAWREACDRLVRVPTGGAASSLNAAQAGTLALYEAARQRGFPHGRPGS